jgi:predicted AlkP superfamily phosphohydrolase/phosphomutase
MTPGSRSTFWAGTTFLAVSAALWALSSSIPPPRVERVILLGFDGAAPNLIEPLLEQGRLPAIKRLIAQGAYGPLRSAHPTKSAILWTSIATGKTMVKHGVIDWTYVNQAGLSVPYSDRKRRVKTYWEILSERGVRTGTLNWWVSYPPSPIANGYIVSNAFKARSDPSTVHPEALFAGLNALRLHYPDDVVPEMTRLGIPQWREEDATVPITATRGILQSYGFYVAHDMTIDRVSDYLWEHQPVQVFSTYFRLIDVTSHLADHYMDRKLYEEAVRREEAGTFDAGAEARVDREFARVMAPIYDTMDRTIAKYLGRLDGRTLLVVCSDHGFRFFQGAYSHANPAQAPPDGVIFLAGPGVKRGYRLSGAVLYDVAPTILYAMGQPVAADMDGTVLRRAFEDGVLRRFPVRTIASYETQARRIAADPGRPEVDKDVLQDLGAIGYIPGPESSPSPPSPSPSAPAARPR